MPRGAMRAANRPKLTDGRIHGIIVKSEQGTGIRQSKRSRDEVDEQEYDRYEVTVQVEGVTGPIEMRMFVGTVLNPDPVNTKGRGKKVVRTYNQLTTLCLALGLVTEEELAGLNEDTIERVETAFLDLEGEKISATTSIENGLHRINLNSVRLEDD